MKSLFDTVSARCSRHVTRAYSTSFSMGINLLSKRLHDPIYSIYGFVRFADEIVDSFEGYDKAGLLARFKADTFRALEEKISLNPVLNSFQHVVHGYQVEYTLIETFFNSMEMDLAEKTYEQKRYETYILGSAEVVGLMCLRVFSENDRDLFDELKPYAMRLGAAFQKVNFLRDIKADFQELGRTYFPGVDLNQFTRETKQRIEHEIEADFNDALVGIKKLPASAKAGVYLAYVYYRALFNKIKGVPAECILNGRIRVSNGEKIGLMLNSMIQSKMRMI